MKKICISFFCIFLCLLTLVVPCSATVNQTMGWMPLTTFGDLDRSDMETISFTAKIGVSYGVYEDSLPNNPYDLELLDNTWYKSYTLINSEYLSVAQLTGTVNVVEAIYVVYNYEYEVVLKVPNTYDILNGIIREDVQLKLWSPLFDVIRVNYIDIEPIRTPTYYPMKNSSCEYNVYLQTNVWLEEANALEVLQVGDDIWTSKFTFVLANFIYGTQENLRLGASHVKAFRLRNEFLYQKNNISGNLSFNLKRIYLENKMSVTSEAFYANTYETFYLYNQQSLYFETPKYIYVGIEFIYDDGLTIIPNGSQTGLGVDFSSLYMPIDINFDDSGNIIKDIQNFFSYLFTKTLPNIINNFVVWFMVEAPLINKVTGPLYLSAIQTKNIVMQWVLPLLTSVGVFGSIIAVVIFIKLIRRLLK